MKHIFYFLVILLPFLSSCNKEELPKTVATDNPKQSNLDILVDNTFKSYIQNTKTAGFSISVIDDTNVSFYNYGETKLGNQTLPDKNTMYEIGSLTKPIIANIITLWCNQNSISLDTPVKNLLPSALSSKFSKEGADVTIKQLLNHTSGMVQLPNNFPSNSDPYNALDSTYILNYINANVILNKKPGTLPSTETDIANAYSNLAYSLVGIILERNTGLSLQEISSQYLFDGLNMNNTVFSDIENFSNRALPTNPNNTASYWHLSGFASAGGLKSNTTDLTKFLQSQIFTNASSPLGQSYQICATPQVGIGSTFYYGSGWEFYYHPSGKRLVAKSGGTGGFTSFMIFDKNSKKGIIGLFNNSSDQNAYVPFFQLADKIFE